MRKVPNAPPMTGMTSDSKLSLRCRYRMRMKIGMIVVCAGTIRVASTMVNNVFFARKRMRAKAYPLIVEVTNCSTTIRPVTTTELMKNLSSGTCRNTDR